MKVLLIVVFFVVVVLTIICFLLHKKVNILIKQNSNLIAEETKIFTHFATYLENLDKFIQKNHAAISTNSDVIKLQLENVLKEGRSNFIDLKADILDISKAVKMPANTSKTSKSNKYTKKTTV